MRPHIVLTKYIYSDRLEVETVAKGAQTGSNQKRTRPALTPEAREAQMIALATDCAEKQMREGKASSQVIVHYLKLGTQRNKLELEKLKRETELLSAKTTAIQSAEKVEQLYQEAMAAMRSYSGQDGESNDSDIQ